jgi:hypothetical protein
MRSVKMATTLEGERVAVLAILTDCRSERERLTLCQGLYILG